MSTGDAGYLIIPTFSGNHSGYYYACVIRVSISGKLTYKHVNNGSDSGISKMLYAAGMTYVASLASNFLQIFRLVIIALSRRRDE